MDSIKRQKLNDAIGTAVAYATKGFLTLMAVSFALLFLVCLTQLFQEPAISLIGGAGFGGGAWTLWNIQKTIQTR